MQYKAGSIHQAYQNNEGISLQRLYRNTSMRMADNFFSILKTECIYRQKIASFEDARKIIDECIDFYINYRIQLKTKLTPLEMRRQSVA